MKHRGTKVEEVADWLVKTGYPYDWQSEHMPPKFLIKEMAHSWSAEDGDSVENHLETIGIELGLHLDFDLIDQEKFWKIREDNSRQVHWCCPHCSSCHQFMNEDQAEEFTRSHVKLRHPELVER